MEASTQALGSMSGLFGARFRRLTARELRLLVLVIDGGPRHREISETLGVSRGSVANAIASIRRKLAVPSHEDLRQFVLSVPELATLVREVDSSDLAAATIERRERHVLRTTITEIEAMAQRVRRRADALGVAAGSDAREELAAETCTVLSIAELIDQLLDQAVSLARQRPERAAAV